MSEDASDLNNEAPAGSESRVLFPETRSGVGSKTTKSNGAETPFPDQAEDGREGIADFFGWVAWVNRDDGQAVLKTISDSGHAPASRALLAAFVAGCASVRRLSSAQSGEDGGERCQACLGNGQRVGPDGYSALVACDQCEGTGSRKERSVSGNVELRDAGEGVESK
jgi:hypothetical protein